MEELDERVLDALATVLKLEPRRRLRMPVQQAQLVEYLADMCQLRFMADLAVETDDVTTNTTTSYSHGGHAGSTSGIQHSGQSPRHTRRLSGSGRTSRQQQQQQIFIEDASLNPPKIVFPQVQDVERLHLIRFPRDDRSPEHPDGGEETERERNATWLELMFDVFFVAVLRILSHSGHSGARQLIILIFKFIVLWWAWLSVILYDTKYDTDDLFHRGGKLFQMMAVAGFALSIEDALENVFLSDLFAVSYILIHVVLLTNYCLVAYSVFRPQIHSPDGRTLTTHTSRHLARFRIRKYVPILTSSLLSIIMVACSTALRDQYTARAILWGIAMIQEAMAHLYAFHVGGQVPFKGSHLPERMGLFTIVVIGEGVIGVLTESSGWILQFTRSVSPSFLSTSTAIYETIALCMLVIIIYYALWSAYFDDFSNTLIIQPTSDPNQFIVKRQQVLYDRVRSVWILLHLGVHLFHALFGIYMVDAVVFFNAGWVVGTSGVSTKNSTMTTMTSSSSSSSSSVTWPPPLPTGSSTPPSLAATSPMATKPPISGPTLAHELMIISALIFLFNAIIKFLGSYRHPQASRRSGWSVVVRAGLGCLMLCLLGVPDSVFESTFSIDHRHNAESGSSSGSGLDGVFWLVVGICGACVVMMGVDVTVQYLTLREFRMKLDQTLTVDAPALAAAAGSGVGNEPHVPPRLDSRQDDVMDKRGEGSSSGGSSSGGSSNNGAMGWFGLQSVASAISRVKQLRMNNKEHVEMDVK